MSTTYTTSVGLGMPAAGDTSWNVPVNANATTLDVLNPVGDLNVTLTEVPSATLNVKVAAGTFVKQDGTVGTYAGTASQAITASSTKVLYLDGTASFALTVAASYPTTTHIRLGTVVAGASTITSITDNRQCFNAAGSIADGVNFTLGTSTGTEIGTSSSQKLGFYGTTPVVQQTGGSATAGSSYTTTEQGMINRMYTSLRALGLMN